MASNDPSKTIFPGGVRVKIEPGTSASSSASSSTSTFIPPENLPFIKSEPNVQPVPTQRLTSFRLPRDLTLGGNVKAEKPKKVYMPNINVQRNKKKDEPSPKVKHESVSQTRDRGRGRGRGRGDRGRGERGRGKTNIVESASVWSQGIWTPPVSRKYSNISYHNDNDTDTPEKTPKFMEKPKLNLNKDIDKEKEEEIYQKLFRTKLTDDEHTHDERIQPLVLPRAKKKSINTEKKIKTENQVSDEPGIISDDLKKLIENNSNSYVTIQFPDCLPGLAFEETTDDDAGAAAGATAGAAAGPTAGAPCTLSNLKDGYLGALQILKSGKMRLRFGNTYFNVDESTKHFRQDLMAVKVDPASLTGETVNLGPITKSLIVSPDLDAIFGDSD